MKDWYELQEFKNKTTADIYVRFHPDLTLKVTKLAPGQYVVEQEPEEFERITSLPALEMISAYEMKSPLADYGYTKKGGA